MMMDRIHGEGVPHRLTFRNIVFLGGRRLVGAVRMHYPISPLCLINMEEPRSYMIVYIVKEDPTFWETSGGMARGI